MSPGGKNTPCVGGDPDAGPGFPMRMYGIRDTARKLKRERGDGLLLLVIFDCPPPFCSVNLKGYKQFSILPALFPATESPQDGLEDNPSVKQEGQQEKEGKIGWQKACEGESD